MRREPVFIDEKVRRLRRKYRTRYSSRASDIAARRVTDQPLKATGYSARRGDYPIGAPIEGLMTD